MSTHEKVMSTAASSIFTPYQVDRLAQHQRFLIHIVDPDIARLASNVNYTSEEHSYGQQRISIAMGQNVPFEHNLSEAQRKLLSAAPSAQIDRIRAVDKFENTWFPRTRAALLRYIDAEHRDGFVAAFFEDLEMQPEGPSVLPNVEQFCIRFESLPQSKVPGAAEAYSALVKRGISKGEIKRIRGLIDASKQEAGEPTPDLVKPEKIAASAGERLTAYDELNRWYNDWAETLRGELSYHQSVRLGIVAVKRGKRNTPEEPSPGAEKPEDE